MTLSVKTGYISCHNRLNWYMQLRGSGQHIIIQTIEYTLQLRLCADNLLE